MFHALDKHAVKMRLKKGDLVVIIAGKDKGKQGKIKEVLKKKNAVVIDGANIVTRHTKPTQKLPQGGRVTKEAAINASNVMIIDPKTNKPTRVGYKLKKNKDGEQTSVRFAKKSGTEFN